jgi:hypothetical protein
MEILEAFDLTRSYRAAAQLTGTDHKTVAHYVERRDAGYDPYAGSAGRGLSMCLPRRLRSGWTTPTPRSAPSQRCWRRMEVVKQRPPRHPTLAG